MHGNQYQPSPFLVSEFVSLRTRCEVRSVGIGHQRPIAHMRGVSCRKEQESLLRLVERDTVSVLCDRPHYLGTAAFADRLIRHQAFSRAWPLVWRWVACKASS